MPRDEAFWDGIDCLPGWVRCAISGKAPESEDIRIPRLWIPLLDGILVHEDLSA